mgnify:CR=1 FL=1
MSKAQTSVPHCAGALLFDADVRILRDRVVLRLSESDDACCLLEYRLMRGDGTTLIQVLHLTDVATLQEFIAGDPYGDHLRVQYQSIGRAYQERSNKGAMPRRTRPEERDPLREIGLIRSCTNEAELMRIASCVLSRLGGRSYTYRWLQVDDKTDLVAVQRCLVGCNPGWFHAYFKYQWYRNDPFVEYARRNGAPSPSGEIVALGKDHWARNVAGRFGLRSSVICPAHAPASSLFGLLQVGNELTATVGEAALWQHRVLFRALAEEMLDWGVARQRSDELSRVDLDQRELAALRLLRAGRTAVHVAESLGVSERTAYGIFRKINDKLGVSHIARAVQAATERGLIE